MLVKHLWLIRYQRRCQAKTHWKQRSRLGAARVCLRTVTKYGQVQLARVNCLGQHMDNVAIGIATQDIRAVHTFTIARETQIGHAEIYADHGRNVHKVWYQV